MPSTLLEVEDLKVHFPTKAGLVRAVDGVSFNLKKGETLGLVGESGCGKSTTGRAVAQLLRPTAGSVRFNGQELTPHWKKRFGVPVWGPELRELRRKVQLIFQDPYASLNPRMTVEKIIGEPLRTFRVASGQALRKNVQDLMARVGLDPRYVRRYPHEFSGGQRQRIGIARALALKPELIICDEPISALDVSIQAQIMNLLDELQRDLGLSYLFIAHDLAAVRHICDRIAVMYLGRIVEVAERDAVFSRAIHPYTRALLSAVPQPDPTLRAERLVLSGELPSPLRPPSGCRFRTRCRQATDVCRKDVELTELNPSHRVACPVNLPTVTG